MIAARHPQVIPTFIFVVLFFIPKKLCATNRIRTYLHGFFLPVSKIVS